MSWIPTALSLGGYIQSHHQHNKEVIINNKLTQKQLDEAQKQHGEQIKCNIDIHTIQHNHNKKSAEREGLRDLWAQYNQKNQTSIITLTLLFSCCFMIYVEGDLPEKTNEKILILYSIIISIQTLLIIISLILLLKIQSRMTKFNIFNRYQVYECGQRHETFNSYFNHHCKKLKKYSSKFCNLGLLFIFLSANILWCCKLRYKFKSKVTSNIFIYINTISFLIICIVIKV